jgi:sortase A
MKKLSLVLIALGIIIAAYPLVGKLYTLYEQNKILQEWNVSQESTNNGQSENIVSDYQSLNEVFDSIETVNTTIAPEPTTIPQKADKTLPKATAKPVMPKPAQIVLGVIKIKKIKVNYPIVEGVKAENLRVGIGHIPGTTAIGEIGNVALAGHRSHAFGLFFNRLNEMNIGDQIAIQIKNKTFIYQVYEKKIVKPDDVTVLNKNKKDKLLTLITCDPVYGATHRLILHAELVE